MDRYWFLTNTCYSNWLPGDERGFVGRVKDRRPADGAGRQRVTHDLPGTPYDEDIPGLEDAARSLMKGPPIRLTTSHADAALAQFRETARFRAWELWAVAIMFNHFHIVVGVNEDPAPGKILGDFKSWGTRRLSKQFGKPVSETWWTERGSKRKLEDESDLISATNYVLYNQANPLLTWSPEFGLCYGPPPGERRGVSPTCF